MASRMSSSVHSRCRPTIARGVPREPNHRPELVSADATQPAARIDVLLICTNPILSLYVAGVVQPFRWTVEEFRTMTEAMDAMERGRTAVVVCEETVLDGTWADVAQKLAGLSFAPALVVVGDDSDLREEVEASGGFGSIVRPLREGDVLWMIASAWHSWMSNFEDACSKQGVTCPGG